MILGKFLDRVSRPRNAVAGTMTMPQLVEALNLNGMTVSGQNVTPESSKTLATAYRALNIISDDVAKLPFQLFETAGPGQVRRVGPDVNLQNMAWLLEVSPNRWMTPMVFKKTLVMGMLVHGAGYVWQPAWRLGQRRELFLLNAATTVPVLDEGGNVWYQTTFGNGKTEYLPHTEVLALIINSTDGISGRGVISYARETLGRQLGAHETQGRFFGQGLNPGGIVYMPGELSKEARDKIRQAYGEAMGGTSNAYRLAVMDAKITKFEQVSMKPVDAQFLEGIQASDVDIANFFGMPLFKLNMGKQSYNSNEQANLDYLETTLDPYLVQMEEAARIKWLSLDEQRTMYWRFNRDALLRTDAKTRAETMEKRILSGQLSPNEARQIEDQSSYEGGDIRYIPANMAMIRPGGAEPISKKGEGGGTKE